MHSAFLPIPVRFQDRRPWRLSFRRSTNNPNTLLSRAWLKCPDRPIPPARRNVGPCQLLLGAFAGPDSARARQVVSGISQLCANRALQVVQKCRAFILGSLGHGRASTAKVRAKLLSSVLEPLGVVPQLVHHTAARLTQRHNFITQACHIFCQHAFSSFFFVGTLELPPAGEAPQGASDRRRETCCCPALCRRRGAGSQTDGFG